MFLHEYYNIASPRRVWERIGEHGAGAIALASIDWVLRNTFRSTLAEALKNYAVWRYFTGPSRYDTVYHFSESNLWPESYVLRSHNTYPASGNQGSRNPSGPGGANFVQFRSGTEDLLNITFDGQDDASWAAYAVGYRSPEQSVEREIVLDANQRGTGQIAWQGNDHIALIAVVTLSPGNLTYNYQAVQEAGNRWYFTGSFNTGRCGHTLTLLPNGKVLASGGWNTSTVFSSCELYDPITETWNYTGSLNQARDAHRAVLLSNGKVLVAAGSYWGDLNSCEIYDPALGRWSYTGSLTKARHSPEMVLLNDGKVLIVGGTRAGRTCELYDPTSETWSITDSIRPVGNGISGHTLTLLPNGKVLLAGGRNESTGEIYAICQLFDPVSGRWSYTGSLNQARAWHRAVLLDSGKVLVVGGVGPTGDLRSCELYDPTTGTWSYTGSLNRARGSFHASLLNNGKVLIAGGWRNIRSAELYESERGLWVYIDSLNQGRSNSTGANSVFLNNGKVLIAGGYPNISSSELYTLIPTSQSQIWAEPRYLNFSLSQNQTKDTILRIFNNGNANLGWSLTENPQVDWLSESPTSGTVQPRPNNRMDVTLSFNTTGLNPGVYHTNLLITNNDPDLPEKIVPVELRVKPSVDIIEYSTTKLLPEVFALENNIPNPFISRTVIRYALPKDSRVNLLVYNSQGIWVRKLKTGIAKPGFYQVVWDGKDDKGRKVPNGVYFYRLEADEFTAAKKKKRIRKSD
uniref:FlgD Ig-like domain-containing protein n=1 Tax=candidate division WOR-3 bacterium TaxID=2052148 RepID=A0A7C3YT86_UNCW3